MAHEPFCGDVPDDRLYCPRHDMWVQETEEGVLIGATSFGVFLAGEIIAFTCKPKGAQLEQGRGLGTVECRKTVLAVHSPIGGRLIEGNDAAEEHPELVNRAPYGQGWMARVAPLDWQRARATLVDAEAYRQHILSVEPEAEIG